MFAGIIKSEAGKPGNFGVLKVTQLLTDQLLFSVALIEIDGVNKRVRNRDCDAAYYVLGGKGRFSIEGVETEVGGGDIVFLPRGTTYQDSGKMTMLSIYQPPFTPDQVEYFT